MQTASAHQPQPSGPLGALALCLGSLKALVIEPEPANSTFAQLTADVSQTYPELTEQLKLFGWDPAHQCFTHVVDLQGLSVCIKKYLYERIGSLGSGSYGLVYQARNRETGELLAIKKVTSSITDAGIQPNTQREICILRELRHENIVQLKDIIASPNGTNIYLVLECLDCDLRYYLDHYPDAQDLRVIKSIMFQLLKAVCYIHENSVMHRDIKPQNIVVNKKQGVVKLTDFGLAWQFLPPFRAHNEKVVTLYYRAPELLLGCANYGCEIDIWSVGAIMAELANFTPLFRPAVDADVDHSEIRVILSIFQVLGTPDASVWPDLPSLMHWNDELPKFRAKPWSEIVPRLANDHLALDLLSRLLAYDPSQRIKAGQALMHPWFNELRGRTSQTNVPVEPGSMAVAGDQQMAVA